MGRKTANQTQLAALFRRVTLASLVAILFPSRLAERRKRQDEDEGKTPASRLVQVHYVAEPIAGTRQTGSDIIDGAFDFDVTQPRLLCPFKKGHRGVEFEIQFVCITIQRVRPGAGAVL